MRDLRHLLIHKYAILLAALLLAGCSVFGQPQARTPIPTLGAEDTTPAPTSTGVQVTLPTATITPTPLPTLGIPAEKLKGVSITFWHALAGAQADLLQGEITRFNLSNPYGIYVNARSLGSYAEIFNNVRATLGTPQMPDLVTAFPEQYLTWQAQHPGLIVELSPYLADADYGLSNQEQADIPAIFLAQDIHGGNRLAFPAQRTLWVLFYNAGWAQELGFTSAPARLEDFRSQVCAAAGENQGSANISYRGTGGWLQRTDALTMLSWLTGFGAQVYDSSADQFSFTTLQIQAAYESLRGLSDSGCLWAGRSPSVEEYFARRQALMLAGSMEQISALTRTMALQGNSDTWQVLPFPSSEGKPVVYSVGPSYVMLKNGAERQLAAWLVMRHLSGTAYQVKLARLTGGYPLRTSAIAEMSDFQAAYPQWGQALQLLPHAQTPPLSAWWRIARPVLEDASAQILAPETSPGDIPTILEQLQQMMQELLALPAP